jgi:hypothetical protein
MAAINDRPIDLLSQTKLNFDLRTCFKATGIASYARAIPRIYGDSARVKFEVYDRPTEDILERWSVEPIIVDKKQSCIETAITWGVTVTPAVAPNVMKQAAEAMIESCKKVESVLITMGFGSYDQFIENSLYQKLLINAVRLCKREFSSMKPDESTVIGLMGRDSYHFDNLLLEGNDSENFSFGPKYPNRHSRFSSLKYKSVTEEKQD